MSDLTEVNRNIRQVDAKLDTLTDQVSTLAVALADLIHIVERSERASERVAESVQRIVESVERSEHTAERNANTIAQLVEVVKERLAWGSIRRIERHELDGQWMVWQRVENCAGRNAELLCGDRA